MFSKPLVSLALLTSLLALGCSDQNVSELSPAQDQLIVEPPEAMEAMEAMEATDENRSASQQATTDYTAECNSGMSTSCIEQSFLSDTPVIWNQKACELDHAVGCANVAANYYQNGELSNSLDYFAKACDLKDQISCTNLGLIQQSIGNIEAATIALGKACFLGDGPSCVSWRQSATTLCQDDVESCLQVADSYGTDSLGDKQYMYQTACDNGYSEACEISGN